VVYLAEGSFVTPDAASGLQLVVQKQLTPLGINGEEFCKAGAEEEFLLLQTSRWVALKAGGFATVSSCFTQALSSSCLEEELGFPLAGKLGSFTGLCGGLSSAHASEQSCQSIAPMDLSELRHLHRVRTSLVLSQAGRWWEILPDYLRNNLHSGFYVVSAARSM